MASSSIAFLCDFWDQYEAGIDPFTKLIDRVSDDNRAWMTLQ